ncbi:transmembrane protein 81 [Pezoporus occidentalis]|uniref:transmembrane protein 81 n=1 Tax=Pezoporus occidentalis TaxID=407982 RepID=UPI002F916040
MPVVTHLIDNPSMEPLGSSHILGLLLCALHVPLVASLAGVTIPAELRSVVAPVVVNTTLCSVTCGLGFKLEELCELSPGGQRQNCTVRRTACLASWHCGLHHFTLAVGQPFQLSCLTSDVAGSGSQAYSCAWSFAPGLITMKDVLFRPFGNPRPVVRFSPTKESDAGTYRCEVQVVKTLRVVKRVYFAVRVIHKDLVDLNFQKFLTWEQKLAASKVEENLETGVYEEQEEEPFWKGELFYQCLLGIGSGVAGGILLSVVLHCLQRIWRGRAAEQRAKI